MGPEVGAVDICVPYLVWDQDLTSSWVSNCRGWFCPSPGLRTRPVWKEMPQAVGHSIFP